MKLKKLFIAILFLGTLLSCSSDDDENNNTGSILGTWDLVSLDYSGNSVASGTTTTFVGEAFDINGDLSFTDNPNGYVGDTMYSIHLTSTTMGQDFETDLTNLSSVNGNGTWSLDGDQLTITPASGSTAQETIFTIQFSNNGNTFSIDTTDVRNIGGSTSTTHIIGVYNRQ